MLLFSAGAAYNQTLSVERWKDVPFLVVICYNKFPLGMKKVPIQLSWQAELPTFVIFLFSFYTYTYKCYLQFKIDKQTYPGQVLPLSHVCEFYNCTLTYGILAIRDKNSRR